MIRNSYRLARVALQLESEERIGFIVRERQRLARAQEDAVWANAANVAEKVR